VQPFIPIAVSTRFGVLSFDFQCITGQPPQIGQTIKGAHAKDVARPKYVGFMFEFEIMIF
jgi:hypothetical protein